ncbi:hypothetical protein BDN67DRAFT_684077 [Paxillus ammoniavirescens]|nr:hypothetical protein BDN67DRAFT_684077 [Paxillus ammoniavirescens]
MGDASPSPTNDMKSLQFDCSPAISSSGTLEEGEITEDEASGIASTPSPRQQKDLLPLKLSNTSVLPRRSTPSLVAEVTSRTSTPTTSLHVPISEASNTISPRDFLGSLTAFCPSDSRGPGSSQVSRAGLTWVGGNSRVSR